MLFEFLNPGLVEFCMSFLPIRTTNFFKWRESVFANHPKEKIVRDCTVPAQNLTCTTLSLHWNSNALCIVLLRAVSWRHRHLLGFHWTSSGFLFFADGVYGRQSLSDDSKRRSVNSWGVPVYSPWLSGQLTHAVLDLSQEINRLRGLGPVTALPPGQSQEQFRH